MAYSARPIAAALIALLVSACGGSGGGSLPVSADNASGSTAPMHARQHKVKGTLRISIPKHKRHNVLIHGHYVSPSTQSITIAITPVGGGAVQSFNTDLTPGSNPSCVASLISPLVCTVSLNLAAGNYTGTFATYDGLLNGAGNPTGNQLSANQSVPISFTLGEANNVNVTLDGVPTSVALVPLNQQWVGNAVTGYSLPTIFAGDQVQVVGVDADKNFIIGTGAPTPALVSNNTSLLTVATPPPSAPNTFTLLEPTVPTAAGSTAQLTGSVTPLSTSGSVQTVVTNVTVAAPVIANGNFAGGTLAPWTACSFTRPGYLTPTNASPAPVSPTPQPTTAPFTALIPTVAAGLVAVVTPPPDLNPAVDGVASASILGSNVVFAGSQNSEVKGVAGICQQVTVPAAQPYLSFYVYEAGSEFNFKFADQEADILDSTGTTVQQLLFSELNCFDDPTTLGAVAFPTGGCVPNGTTYPGFSGTSTFADYQGGYWVPRGPYNLTAYAGTTITIFIGEFDESLSAAPNKDWNGIFIGNVQMSAYPVLPDIRRASSIRAGR
jgi:hypothetical protein